MNALTESQIRRLLPSTIDAALAGVDVFDKIGSTSSYLLAEPSPAGGEWRIAIAGQQTAGRGRGDKPWHSPAGGGLWMSAAYTFVALPERLSALTLAIGVGVATTLRRLGVANIALKWPNDLLVDGRKLGGILLDSYAAGDTGTTIVCGLGLNTELADGGLIDDAHALEPVDLKAVLQDVPPVQQLAATMIQCIVDTTRRYEEAGFGAFSDLWTDFDYLRGRRIAVHRKQDRCVGVADGVTEDGALVVRDGNTVHHVVTGTVRLTDDGEATA